MRLLLFLGTFVFLSCAAKPPSNEEVPPQPSAGTSRVLFVIAHNGFRDEELEAPQRILEEAGLETTVASTDTTTAVGMLGAKIRPDLLIADVKPDDYEAIVIVGGVGIQKLWDDTTLIGLAREFNRQGKVIGAICLAPVILARAGLLEDVDATCSSSASSELSSSGSNYVSEDVVCSGKIVTASGPRAAETFGRKLLSLLKKEKE